MSPVVDASTPARVTNSTGTTATTASFTPPDPAVTPSLLVACTIHDTTGGTNINYTMSASAGVGTWTQRVLKDQTGTSSSTECVIYTAAVSASGARTVTVTTDVTNDRSMLVYVITGHDPATPVGDTTSGTSTINVLPITGLIASRPGSLGIYQAVQDDGPPSAASTSPDGNFSSGFINGQIDGGSGWKVMADTGETQYAVDGPGTTAIEWNWCGIEILAPLVSLPPLMRPELSRFRHLLPR